MDSQIPLCLSFCQLMVGVSEGAIEKNLQTVKKGFFFMGLNLNRP